MSTINIRAREVQYIIMDLNEIYICDTENNCTAIPDTEEYKTSRQTYMETEKTLLNTLNDEQNELFFGFMDAYNVMAGLEDQERYKQGFAAGIRITSEAFLIGKENKQKNGSNR